MTDIKKGQPLTKAQRRTAKNKKAFLEAFKLSVGNISVACDKIKISRECYYHWRETDPDFDMKVEALEEADIDFSETMLKKNIREGKEASIFFHLKTKGKKRGYIERTEFTGKDGAGLMVDISDAELKEKFSLIVRLQKEDADNET